ncbi:MAG: ORF6N domain-containing protein [Planctomycetia bacterium]|nr:ORF6N domain-containing protein [Planctomycetia bacterium]
MTKRAIVVSQEQIESAVLVLRGERVLLDADLAAMYSVTIGALNQAIRRNRSRFPPDFMFRLTKEEFENWKSQTVISSSGEGQKPSKTPVNSHLPLRSQTVTLKTGRGQHRKYLPYAFTEQGVAMLSSVLRSERAVRVNVEIMRAFVRLRKILAVNTELAARLDELERRVGKHDEQFNAVIRASLIR